MTAKTAREAWEAASAIMPTDFEYDSARSAAAGYSIYYSTAFNTAAWISDLGSRLEVNLPNGKSVNIWIEKEKAAEKTEAELDREATETAKTMNVSDCFTPEAALEITVVIDGEYGGDDAKKIYDAIKRGNKGIIYNVIERYCVLNGIVLGSIGSAKAEFYEHGKNTGRGHYICSGIVKASCGREIDFLTKCGEYLLKHADEYDPKRREA